MSASWMAMLRPVWPPRVGRRASGRSASMIFSTIGDRDGLDVGGVRHLRVRHDRGGVGVDQDDAEALLPQRLAGLRARVVELAGLADDDRPGPDDEDRVDVRSFRHAVSSRAPARPVPARARPSSAANRAKRYPDSCGPGLASGWYCTLKRPQLRVLQAFGGPVIQVHVGHAASPGAAESMSTLNPWFWDVMAIRPVCQVLHGVIAAVVAELQLVRLSAQRQAQHLLTQADAEYGKPPRSSRTVSMTYVTGSGSPGPLETTSPSGCDARMSPRGRVRGNHRHPVARGNEVAEDVPLHAAIEDHDVPAGASAAGAPADPFRPCVGRGAGDLLHEVDADDPRRRGELSARDARSRSPLEITPCLAPSVRRWRVSARVSMPWMPTTPCSASQCLQVHGGTPVATGQGLPPARQSPRARAARTPCPRERCRSCR